jgi:hypothetical protein
MWIDAGMKFDVGAAHGVTSARMRALGGTPAQSTTRFDPPLVDPTGQMVAQLQRRDRSWPQLLRVHRRNERQSSICRPSASRY